MIAYKHFIVHLILIGLLCPGLARTVSGLCPVALLVLFIVFLRSALVWVINYMVPLLLTLLNHLNARQHSDHLMYINSVLMTTLWGWYCIIFLFLRWIRCTENFKITHLVNHGLRIQMQAEECSVKMLKGREGRAEFWRILPVKSK